MLQAYYICDLSLQLTYTAFHLCFMRDQIISMVLVFFLQYSIMHRYHLPQCAVYVTSLYYRNAEMMPLFIKCLGHFTEKVQDYFTNRNLALSYKALFIPVRCGNARKIAHFPTWHINLGPLCRRTVVPIMALPCANMRAFVCPKMHGTAVPCILRFCYFLNFAFTFSARFSHSPLK